MTREQQIRQIEESWKSDRWNGVERPYTAADVVKLRGSIVVEQTLARIGAERL
ncbi:isocitrate lyase, partial [Ammoniphilus sp. 3BR4]